jgi:hypothetical protein
MITLILFVSTFNTAESCVNFSRTDQYAIIEYSCNEDVVKAEFYNLRK